MTGETISAAGHLAGLRRRQLVVSERNDRVIYGPRGEVVRRIEDRPFRGYKGQHRG